MRLSVLAAFTFDTVDTLVWRKVARAGQDPQMPSRESRRVEWFVKYFRTVSSMGSLRCVPTLVILATSRFLRPQPGVAIMAMLVRFVME